MLLKFNGACKSPRDLVKMQIQSQEFLGGYLSLCFSNKLPGERACPWLLFKQQDFTDVVRSAAPTMECGYTLILLVIISGLPPCQLVSIRSHQVLSCFWSLCGWHTRWSMVMWIKEINWLIPRTAELSWIPLFCFLLISSTTSFFFFLPFYNLI